MNRKIIIISAIAGLGVIAGLLYWAISVQKESENPAFVQPQIRKVLDEKTISPIPSYDNSSIWYFSEDGRLFKVNIDGSGLSEFPLPEYSIDLKKVLWPKTGTDFLAIGIPPIQGGVLPVESKSYYDSADKSYVYLRPNVQSIDWLPDSQRVVYIWKPSDGQSPSLVVADADGSGFRKVSDVFWPDLVVKASNDGRSVLLYRSQMQGDTNKIYLADLASGGISTAVESGINLGGSWFPSGSQFVYAQLSDAIYSKLYVYDLISKTSKSLNLTTNLDKILIDRDNKFIYAAVPKVGTGSDQFIKLDLGNLKQEIYFDPPDYVSAKDLMMVGNTLYFVNSRDGKLYSIIK